MKVLCVSASNMIHKENRYGASYKICEIVSAEINKKIEGISHSIIELKRQTINPCIGCGECLHTNRCVAKDDFNKVYKEIIGGDIIIIVSPHYAPIPAKLAALLEKMEQITFLKWGKDNSYKSEIYGKPTGIISHGGGEEWALKSYKKMVNDTIANALDTIQLKVVPLNEEWDTGISLPVKKASFAEESIFPYQEYDWEFIMSKISEYAEQIKNAVQCNSDNL